MNMTHSTSRAPGNGTNPQNVKAQELKKRACARYKPLYTWSIVPHNVRINRRHRQTTVILTEDKALRTGFLLNCFRNGCMWLIELQILFYIKRCAQRFELLPVFHQRLLRPDHFDENG